MDESNATELIKSHEQSLVSKCSVKILCSLLPSSSVTVWLKRFTLSLLLTAESTHGWYAMSENNKKLVHALLVVFK